MKQSYNKKLILEDGTEYLGYSFGSHEEQVLEVVFNTSMAGYQEIISDLSYTDQAVVMSYPLIGNYGINADDFETKTPAVGGLIVRDYNDEPSNFRSKSTLSETMKRCGITGIYGVDTRKLVREIRDFGSMRGFITSVETSAQGGVKRIRDTPIPHNSVYKVSRKSIIRYPTEGNINIVAIDCGIKQNIIRTFLQRGVSVIVVPFDTTAEKIRSFCPNGIFISNGPGDPMDAACVIETIQALKGRYCMFGICLGHQIIALAYGAKTYKLKFGHRGGNHPVKNLKTGKIEITSQNHSYAVEQSSLSKTPLVVTHTNLLDGTVEGVACEKDRVFSVQYHPEGAPGPQDSMFLFDHFINLIKENQNA